MLFKSIYLKPKNVTWAVFYFSPQTCGFHVTKQFTHKAKTVIIPWQHAATGKKVCDNNHTHTHPGVFF